MSRVHLALLGELPPKTYTGISMINAGVIDVLKRNGKQILAIDESNWKKKGLLRIFAYFSNYGNIFCSLLFNRVKLFYLNIPLSKLGLMRLLFVCFLSKLTSPRVKLIGHIHRGDISNFIENKNHRALLKTVLNNFYKVLVLSNIFVDDVKSISSKANVEVLANTSFFESYFSERSSKRYSAQYVCISNFIRSKGLAQLVEAFANKKLIGCKLLIVGNVYDSDFYLELEKSKTSNVELLKTPNRDEVLFFTKTADCFVLPSWNEGQPIVLLEAMSLGIPIIANSVGDIPSMLGDGYQFIISKKNTNNLVDTISSFHLLEDKTTVSTYLSDRYKRLFSNARFEREVLRIFQ